VVEFDYYIPATNTNVNGIIFHNAYFTVTGAKTHAITVPFYYPNGVTAIYAYLLKNGSYSAFVGAGSLTDDLVYIKNVTVKEVGSTLALEPEGIQPAPGQWLDSSTNKLHALQPAAGSSLVRRKKDFEFRWTNIWTASAAAQYIGGLAQDVLTAKHYITQIISKTTETTDVENIEIGDEADPNRYVTAAAPGTSAAPVSHTIALAIPDGTNGQFVVTPAASATMTIEFIVRGFLLEP
jgi:hypothetical protein